MKLKNPFLPKTGFSEPLLDSRSQSGRISPSFFAWAALLIAAILSGPAFAQRVATSTDETTLPDKFKTIEDWVNNHDPAFPDPTATIQLKSQNALGLVGTAKTQLDAVSFVIQALMEQRDWGLPAVATPKTLKAIKEQLCDSVLWVDPVETTAGSPAWYQRGSRNLSLGEDMWCNPGGGHIPVILHEGQHMVSLGAWSLFGSSSIDSRICKAIQHVDEYRSNELMKEFVEAARTYGIAYGNDIDYQNALESAYQSVTHYIKEAQSNIKAMQGLVVDSSTTTAERFLLLGAIGIESASIKKLEVLMRWILVCLEAI